MTTITGTFGGVFQYYAFAKLAPKTTIRNGIIMGGVGGLLSLGHCVWEHFETWKEYQQLEQYRERRSYSIPDKLQRSRDIENYESAHRDEIMIKQKEVMEKSRDDALAFKRLTAIDSISQFKKNGV